MYVFNRDVSSHLNYEHRVFNSQEFLKTREPAEELFYKTVNIKVLFCYIFVHYSFVKRIQFKTCYY